jgi:hypothetical protein
VGWRTGLGERGVQFAPHLCLKPDGHQEHSLVTQAQLLLTKGEPRSSYLWPPAFLADLQIQASTNCSQEALQAVTVLCPPHTSPLMAQCPSLPAECHFPGGVDLIICPFSAQGLAQGRPGGREAVRVCRRIHEQFLTNRHHCVLSLSSLSLRTPTVCRGLIVPMQKTAVVGPSHSATQ